MIDGFEGDDPLVAASIDTLEGNGHDVEVIDLDGVGFTIAMSNEERRAYHGPDNLITAETRAGADAIGAADALLFCYPTTTYTLPARVKAFLDRVLVPEVAFTFDDKGRVAPAMTNIRRLGVVTRRSHGRVATIRARDAGRRTILRTLRLNCHRFCRRTFIAVAGGDAVTAVVRRRLGRW